MTETPTNIPTDTPTYDPTVIPSNVPSNIPSDTPSNIPTDTPTNLPSLAPSDLPTNVPSGSPSVAPTDTPTDSPSLATVIPSNVPSFAPSISPLVDPSDSPTTAPVISATLFPTKSPIIEWTPKLCVEQHSSKFGVFGPSVYKKSDSNFNDFIRLYTNIDNQFNDDCYNININNKYNILWSINIFNIYNENNINQNKLNSLINYLNNNTNSIILNLDINEYLQVGLKYVFNMTIKCIDNNCLINKEHELFYDYSLIECKINKNDIDFGLLSIQSLNTKSLLLDANFFTFDPDKSFNDKDHLIWDWNCQYNSTNCNNILNNIGSGFVSVIFSGAFMKGQTYVFDIYMNVSDNTLPFRSDCFDMTTIQFRIAEENEIIPINSLIVSLIALETLIAVDEKVKIISDVSAVNYDTILSYNWMEISNKIDVSYITTPNLILDEYRVSEGETYTFVLIVNEYDIDGILISNGTSMIDITVKQNPVINSFIVIPSCNNVSYQDIKEAINENAYTLAINGSGMEPLIYKFGVGGEIINYFHTSYVFEYILNDVMLPIGNNILYGFLYDNDNANVHATTYCDISIQSFNCEMNEFEMIVESRLDELFDEGSKYIAIFKISQIYLSYINQYSNDIDNVLCVLNNLDDILRINYEYFSKEQNVLCELDEVNLLSDVIYNWIEILLSNQIYINHFLTDLNDTVYLSELIKIIYDPCNLYNNIINDFDLLFTKYESLLINKPKVFYRNETNYNDYIDITKYISKYIINNNNNKFYSFISLNIELLNNFYISNLHINEGNKMYSYIKYGLYLYELIKSSLYIPNELNKLSLNNNSIDIYTHKINNNNINITISNISVFIGNELTRKNNPNILDGNDIIILGFNNTIQNVSYAGEFNNECDNNDLEGELNNRVISINIIGDINTSTLNGNNVSMSFKVSELPDEFECVYLDEINNIWRNDGCITLYDEYTSTVTCICTHLTTFSIIKNIHSNNPCSKANVYDAPWQIVNLVFGILYLIITLYIAYLELPFIFKPYIRQYIFHSTMKKLHVIFLISIFQLAVCIQFYVLSTRITKTNEDIMTLILLIPLVLWFALFSMLFLAWYLVSRAMDNNTPILKRNMQIRLMVLNVVNIMLLVSLYILVLMDKYLTYLYIMESFWIFMIIIACILLTWYGHRTTILLINTIQRRRESSRNISSNTSTTQGPPNIGNTESKFSSTMNSIKNKILKETSKEKKLAKRFMRINIIICIHFGFKFIATLYLCIFPNKLDIYWYIFDSLINVVTLITIAIFFKQPATQLVIRGSQQSLQSNTSKISTQEPSIKTPKDINSIISNNTNDNLTKPTSPSSLRPYLGRVDTNSVNGEIIIPDNITEMTTTDHNN